ncbi:MAG: hypothetical protein LBS49_10630 [Candidatus Accumulibacter sp.]|jgi:hypothetical protein|nr:hypothetical protein [Accumulibacter sp.]
MNKIPKSYLADAEREGLTQSEIYLAESQAAGDAGDEETAWAWLRYADLPAYSLMTMKRVLGADFVREQNFLCIGEANRAYGENWLDE